MPKGVYERTPETKAKMSKAHTGVPLSPEHSTAILVGRRNSDAVKSAYEAQKGVPQSPEHIAAASKGREEAGVYDAQRGGNDICEHHYIYDHSDLSKYTMKMTRAAHTRLHWLMRKANIIVPHINIKE